MPPERWKQISDVYDAALAHVESERNAFLIEACAGDDALRREVDSLLARPASAPGFLTDPAAAIAAPPMSDVGDSLSGRRVGPYEVQELLGAGGMGEVYRARDTKLGRDVGIKILPRPFASDPERLARFAREARVLASLNHPHIGAIYGFENAGGVHALVLELVEGPTVADRIALGAMPLDEVLPIAKQITDALEAAHEQGIVHRDLKPANIKVRPDGTVKVLDFGLAKALESVGTSNVTQSPTITSPAVMTGIGMILGTAAYMSPEQARGRPADRRSDIWAFGCVLYEMLTGRRAFAGDTVSDTIAAILGREPDWSVLPAETPRPIRRLLQRCLEKHAKRRLHDIADARIEIDDVSREPADAGTLVYVPASTTVTDRTLLRVDRDGRVSSAIEPRAGYEHPALSSDGRRVAVAIASETGHDIWIIDLERATRIRLTSGGTSAFPVWGPDRASVSFQSSAPGPWNLFSKPLDGSEARPLLRVADSPAQSWPNPGASLLPGTLPTLSGAGPQFPVSWAPDGATLAFHERKPNGERDIWVVSPDSDPVPFLLTPFDERSPQFSPDGKWLAYVSDESGRNDVYVQPFPGPGPKWLVSTDGGIDPLWSRDGRELFYRHNDQMMAVLVASKGEFSTGRPQRLFEIRFDAGDDGPNYDVSPDGKWFVMPRSE